jgi:outer membrane protein assembly factor BamB
MRKQAMGLALALCCVVSPAAADEWPAWRGPRGDGVSDEKNIPLHWGKTDKVHWKAAIPGRGYSSPIIWGERIFLTTCLEKDLKRMLLCLDRADGKMLWQRVVLTSKLERKHSLNSYASSTPATDGRHVWVSFLEDHDIHVACYDFQGKRVWHHSPGKFYSVHGFCSSPILYKDMVIINGDQDAEAYLVALEKATGRERWRADRPNRTRSYCAPLIIDAAGKKQLVLSGSKCVASYDPDTGKQHWIIDGPTEQFVASPVFLDGILFITAGFPEHHVLGIRPDGQGNVTKTKILWRHQKGASYVPSPLARDKYFFVVSDGGIASCFEARSGKRLWMKRLGRRHSASPVAAGPYLYFPDDDGITWVVKAGGTFELVSKNVLGEGCYASPAISRGQIFVRTVGHLYCIGVGRNDKSRD